MPQYWGGKARVKTNRRIGELAEQHRVGGVREVYHDMQDGRIEAGGFCTAFVHGRGNVFKHEVWKSSPFERGEQRRIVEWVITAIAHEWISAFAGKVMDLPLR